MYRYQEYPRALYHPDHEAIVVRDDDEKAARLAEGWSISPTFDQPAAEPEEAPAPTPRKRKK